MPSESAQNALACALLTVQAQLIFQLEIVQLPIAWLLSSSFEYSKKDFTGGREMGSIIGAIVIGLIVGALAKAIMPGKDPGGIIVTILIGIVGSIIGHYIAAAIYSSEEGPGFIMRLVFAVIGSLILLGGYRLITGRSSSTRV
jgi:uncharacterized membrane protein YeaQ/YmgE (transglycosylase-associated protein family)